jgi:hypothetical protein
MKPGAYMRREAAGASGVKRADDKGEQLVFAHIDPRGRGSKRILADGFECPADIGMQDRECDIGADHGDRHHHVVIRCVRVEPPPGNDRRRDVTVPDRRAEIVRDGNEDPHGFGGPSVANAR